MFYCRRTLLLSVDKYLGCFHLLTIMKNAAKNIYVQVLTSLRYIHRNGIFGSYSNSMFNLFKEQLGYFQIGCSILHSHQQCLSVTISPCPVCYLFFSLCVRVCKMIIIPVTVKGYLLGVLIFISILANDTEYLLRHLYVIFGELSIQIPCLFLIGLSFWVLLALYMV